MPVLDIVDAENFPSFMDIVPSIVSTIISSCKFPNSENQAVIKPILKGKLDNQKVSSYRLVFNLPLLSKLFEYVIIEQLIEHLEKVNVLPDS